MKKVAAIKYDKENIAPQVTAKGKGFIAEKLLEKAQLEEVPIYKDEKLVDELTKIDLGDNIPKELYEVVAEILVFLDRLDMEYK